VRAEIFSQRHFPSLPSFISFRPVSPIAPQPEFFGTTKQFIGVRVRSIEGEAMYKDVTQRTRIRGRVLIGGVSRRQIERETGISEGPFEK
jgi:hypothetical protein